MNRVLKLTLLSLCACAIGASAAMAQVDVNLAFDPTTAQPGDQVSFFASVANLGSEQVLADLALTVQVGAFKLGPIGGKLPLAAGQELSREISFVVPPLPMGGDLTITVTATAGESTDTASATLTVVAGQTAGGNAATIGPDILKAFGVGTADSEPATIGQLKQEYR